MSNSTQYHRRSIRLKDYDYSQAGAYFVTLCTHQRNCLFGEIAGDEMEFNAAGYVVHEEWLRTQAVRPYVLLEEFIIMPNHLHAIIFLTDDYEGINVRATCQVALTALDHSPPQQDAKRPTCPKSGSIGAIIAQFKRITTLQINKLHDVETSAPVWQRNYYEEIIRNEAMLEKVRQYILCNPQQWAADKDNPANVPRME